MIQAGVGAQITLALGGKLSMPAIGLSGQPRTVTGRVQLISDGRHTNLGPMYRGEAVDMGLSAVLDTGRVQIVVISNHVEPHDLAAFTVPPVGCRLGAAGVATPLHLRDGACVVCRQPLPRPVLLTALVRNRSWWVLQAAELLSCALRWLVPHASALGQTPATCGDSAELGDLAAPRVRAAVPLGRTVLLGPRASEAAAGTMVETPVWPSGLAATAWFSGSGPALSCGPSDQAPFRAGVGWPPANAARADRPGRRPSARQPWPPAPGWRWAESRHGNGWNS